MSSEIRQAFGRRIRTLRKERGYSLRQFSLTIGVDKSFMVDIEYGRKSPTLDTLDRISRGFGMSLSRLFEGVTPVGGAERDEVPQYAAAEAEDAPPPSSQPNKH